MLKARVYGKIILKLTKEVKRLNGNKLKLVAATTMFFDHMGLLLFPHIVFFRIIGRLSMPLYAFLISEGAIHTSNKLKYFLEIFLMGALCQSVYIIEELLTFGIRSVYLNILITFSFSLLIIFPYLKAKKLYEKKLDRKAVPYFLLFILALSFAVFFEVFSRNSLKLTGISVKTDYGLMGMLLPFSACLFKDKFKRLLSFSVCLIIFNFYIMASMPYTWFSLLVIPLLLIYNGKRGKKGFKYAFYLFYPLHLGFLYILAMLI